MKRLVTCLCIVCVCPLVFRASVKRGPGVGSGWRRGPVERPFKVRSANAEEPRLSSDGTDDLLDGVEEELPKIVPRRLRDPFWMDEDEEENDDEESYENKWRRRRISSLKTAPELSPIEIEDLFEPDYLTKKVWTQNPNTAFGAIFKLEGVVCDVDVVPTFTAAWTQVAEEFEVEIPDQGSVAYILNQALRDEVAIERVFRWTRDWSEARRMSMRYTEIVAEKFDELDIEPRPGVENWLQDLRNDDVPCCIVSKIPLNMLNSCLDKLNYTHFFDEKLVTAEDERDRSHQAFLHAALLLERQPSRCVVFSDTVQDLIGAHEADMRAVGLVGLHPAYELQVADLVILHLAELRLANVRRLFSDIDFDPTIQLEPELLPEPRRSNTIALLDRPDEYDDQESDYYRGTPSGGSYSSPYDDQYQ